MQRASIWALPQLCSWINLEVTLKWRGLMGNFIIMTGWISGSITPHTPIVGRSVSRSVHWSVGLPVNHLVSFFSVVNVSVVVLSWMHASDRYKTQFIITIQKYIIRNVIRSLISQHNHECYKCHECQAEGNKEKWINETINEMISAWIPYLSVCLSVYVFLFLSVCLSGDDPPKG